MTRASSLVAVIVFGVGLTLGAQPQTVAPTPLEALAERPDAVVTLEKTVGRLESAPAGVAVEVAALAVEAPNASPMRGVRILLRRNAPPRSCDLKHTEWAEMCRKPLPAAFIEEARLPQFMVELAKGIAVVHDGHTSGITTFSASGSGVSRAGVLVFGMEVNGTTLPELAALVDRARAELSAR